MTAYFPSSLIPSGGQPDSVRRANRRLLRKKMKERATELIKDLGYTLNSRLDLGRAVAYMATKDGISVKIGIRSGAERWVALTQSALSAGGELAEVEELFVATFADTKKRDSIELWRFETSVVVDMAEKIFAASGTTGQQWLPLDDTQDTDVHSMVAGNLKQYGERVAKEPVTWVGAAPASSSSIQEEDGLIGSATTPAKLTIAEAKAGLAAYFGVAVDNVRITIEG